MSEQPEYVAVKHRATPAGITATEIAPWLSVEEQEYLHGEVAFFRSMHSISIYHHHGRACRVCERFDEAIALMQSRLYPTTGEPHEPTA